MIYHTKRAMKTIYLIRHAQSESNAMQAVRPNHAIALTELGHRQASEVAQWLSAHVPTPDKVFVSPYIRTQETAQPYLDTIGQTASEIEPLREFNYLNYERIKDLKFRDIVKIADDYWAKGDAHHADSEETDNFVNLIERVQAVRDEFANLPDGTYVAFTHGMWLGMLSWQLIHGYHGKPCPRVFDMIKFRQFELATRPKNCEVYALVYDGKHSTISKVRVRGDD